MNVYSSVNHSLLSLMLVTVLAGAVISGLAMDQPGRPTEIRSQVQAPQHQAVPVLPEITVRSARLPS